MPVWPTWSECGRQPALVTAREQPTAAPSSSASSSITAEALGRADAATAGDDDVGVGQRDAAAAGGTVSIDANRAVGVGHADPTGASVSTAAIGCAATACAALVSSSGAPVKLRPPPAASRPSARG